MAAFQKSLESGDKIPIGVIYRETKPDFHKKNQVLSAGVPLVDRQTDPGVLQKLVNEFV